MIKLRDYGIAQFNTIDVFIENTTNYANFAKKVLKDIHSRHGRSTLLLLEGWDELPEEKQSNSFFC